MNHISYYFDYFIYIIRSYKIPISLHGHTNIFNEEKKFKLN